MFSTYAAPHLITLPGLAREGPSAQADLTECLSEHVYLSCSIFNLKGAPFQQESLQQCADNSMTRSGGS